MAMEVARKIVKDSLRISKDDAVLVTTWQHTLDLANAIALEASKAGADVLVALETDELYLRTVQELPEEYLREPSKQWMGLLDTTTAMIGISGPENPAIFKKMPSRKLAALFEGEKAIEDKAHARKIRSAFILQGYVTPQRARTYGISYAAWRREMNAALAVDYAKLKEFGKNLAGKLSKAREAHVMAPNGTDLKFEIAGRPVHIEDGVVDEEDIAKGSLSTSLPSGEVYVAPIETSGNGTVVSNLPIAQLGKWIQGLRWTFEGGKVKGFEAKRNLELIKPLFDKATGDKDRIGFFSLGINPNAKTGFLHDYIAQGIVAVGIGANKHIGGQNDSSFEFGATISKATVELDGKAILKDGKYVL